MIYHNSDLDKYESESERQRLALKVIHKCKSEVDSNTLCGGQGRKSHLSSQVTCSKCNQIMVQEY